MPVALKNGCLTVRILLDLFSLEIFVNNGEQAASFVLYSPEDADGIRFRSIGRTTVDIVQYAIQGTVPDYIRS
jgi:beta-fructofuranosidase